MKKLIYFLVGEKNEEMLEYIENIKNKENISSENYFYFDDENNPQEVLLELNNFSLFFDKRLIVYKTENILQLETYFKAPDENSILVIIITKLSKEITFDYVEKVEFKKLSEKDLIKYINKSLEKNKKKITEGALNEFIKRTDLDYLTIKTELNKILLYLDDTIEEIDLNLITNLVPLNLEDNVFSIIEAILERNKRKTWTIYQDLLKKNQDSIQILNVLQNKFNELYYTKILLNAKKTSDEIREYFGYSKGRTFYTIKAANSFDLESINYFIKALSDLEYKIKSGQVEKNLAIELFILELR